MASQRSESTHRLIALAEQVASGQAAASELDAALADRERGLLQSRQDFVQRQHAFPAELAESIRPFADPVIHGHDRYAEGLRALRAWLGGGADDLQGAIDLLRRSGDEMLELLTRYELALMTVRGPTDHPMLNGLVHACEAASQGAPAADLAALAAHARGMLTFAASEGAPRDPLTDRLRAGAAGYLQAVEEIERYVHDQDASHLADAAALISQTATALHDGAALLRDGAKAAGPTGFPLANAILNNRAALADGRIPSPLLAELVDALQLSFDKMRAALQKALAARTSSALLEEEAARAKQAILWHEEALAELHEFVASGDAASLSAGADRLQQAIDALASSRDAFMALSDREGKILCVWCNRANEPHSSNCSKCGRLLPRWSTGEARATSTFSVGESGGVAFSADCVATANMQRLSRATDDFAAGRMAADEYERVLDWMEDLARRGQSSLDALRPADADAAEHRDRASQAIASLRHGLSRLRHSVLEGEDLSEGMQIVQQAAEALHETGSQAAAALD